MAYAVAPAAGFVIVPAMIRSQHVWMILVWSGLALACETPAAPRHDTPAAAPAPKAASLEASPAAAAPATPDTSPKSPASAELTRVTDPSLVCMVNNQFMGSPQIPIEVEGRTYFGCCEMCKARLGSDPSSRVAKDPVSGHEVDKATAVIGKTRTGQTLYFENERNFTAYSSGS